MKKTLVKLCQNWACPLKPHTTCLNNIVCWRRVNGRASYCIRQTPYHVKWWLALTYIFVFSWSDIEIFPIQRFLVRNCLNVKDGNEVESVRLENRRQFTKFNLNLKNRLNKTQSPCFNKDSLKIKWCDAFLVNLKGIFKILPGLMMDFFDFYIEKEDNFIRSAQKGLKCF